MSNLSIALLNINGLTPERLEAVSHSVAYNCDIICFTETHLHANSNTSTLQVEGYQNIIRLDRVGGNWGGVAVLVANHLYVSVNHDYNVPGLELLWVRIRHRNKVFMLGICYRPPSATTEFWEKLQDSIDNIKSQSAKKITLMPIPVQLMVESCNPFPVIIILIFM